VRAILEAAAQLLEAQGQSGVTTDRIAERAGVSVGSLYQYFPSKEAIVATLARCHLLEGARALAPVFERMAEGAPLDETLPALVRETVAVHARSPRLHRLFADQTPLEPADAQALDAGVGVLAARLATYLAGRPEVRVRDPALAARLVLETLSALAHRFAIDPAAGAPVAAREAELVRLLSGYLVCPDH
jgi:AcrR family transcriptional regulator